MHDSSRGVKRQTD